jgi:hypothetical protein
MTSKPDDPLKSQLSEDIKVVFNEAAQNKDSILEIVSDNAFQVLQDCFVWQYICTLQLSLIRRYKDAKYHPAYQLVMLVIGARDSSL